MPQFDNITFFNQIFWLVLLFLIFYFLLLKKYLPNISFLIKIRSKKLLKNDFLTHSLFSENSFTKLNGNKLMEKILHNEATQIKNQKGYEKPIILNFFINEEIAKNGISIFLNFYIEITQKIISRI